MIIHLAPFCFGTNHSSCACLHHQSLHLWLQLQQKQHSFMASFFIMTPRLMNMKTTMCWRGTNQSLDGRGNKNKPYKLIPATDLQLKTNIQALPTIDTVLSPGEILKNKMEMASTPTAMPQRAVIIEQLYKMAEPTSGTMVDNGLVFRQYFTVRSFDIGSDFKMSIAALMNYLQETTLNHLKKVGLMADGFGSSAKMSANNLLWVACSSQIELDYYPSCLYVMMNKKTRKFAKFSEEIAEEMKPFLKECDPIVHKDNRNFAPLDIANADHVRTGLKSGWTDMDANKHVNHIKLINYVLQSVPQSIWESHELSAINLEYRNECNGNTELKSLSKVASNNNNRLVDNVGVEFNHLLRLESGQEIVRARTTWKPKNANIARMDVQT
ncbi:Acyl-[acyl-carrier-protein] hydrolase [Melia azedarach]|uniref:Acyl-[acyl-carrier-protein] hydrolase n=1 Tax=Melia azedarach TaxID=155640 RepID=A0ACC1Y3V6_MELAZ|nr:Acyl-[acyl-carrier-protein] hydrolase [Melia azedarach]